LDTGGVRKKLGLHESKWCATGAAPITSETLEYFASLGIRITELYGMSECSGPTTLNTADCVKWGSIGFEMLGGETKIFAQNEDGIINVANSFQ
jgi:long-chain-fatty-acid--CoA ligase ACSBG